VTRKITLGLGEWLKTHKPIELGNLDAKRDWGHAKDYVEAMWLMLQQPEPDDFVIGTGETHSIREFIEIAVKEIGDSVSWEGQGV
jgi:GDPmannose 4,6-dehydratase